VRSPAWNAGNPVSLIAADIHLGLGRAGITAGGLENPLFKSCANLVRHNIPIFFNMLIILQRIKWMRIHAFLKGTSSNHMQRIMMLNV
jgi:hypothetical protein